MAACEQTFMQAVHPVQESFGQMKKKFYDYSIQST